MIGYYAHSYGLGHSNYARLLQKSLRDDMIIFTSSDAKFPEEAIVTRLPAEDLNGSELSMERFPHPSYLHYAPAGLKNVTLRNYTILKECIRWSVKLMVIDVSVEQAALARVCSIPYAYVRMFGERNDLPHIGAYEGAAFLIAYYPEELEPETTPLWIRKKTVYLGFFSRYSNYDTSRIEAMKKLRVNPDSKFITFISGFGGHDHALLKIEALATQFPAHLILVLGHYGVKSTLSNIMYMDIVSDVAPYIIVSDFVVATCGSSLVSELVSLKAKFMVIPEERPFNEQHILAQALEEKDLTSIVNDQDFQAAKNKLDKNIPEWNRYINPKATEQFTQWLILRNFKPEGLLHDIYHSQRIQDIVARSTPKKQVL